MGTPPPKPEPPPNPERSIKIDFKDIDQQYKMMILQSSIRKNDIIIKRQSNYELNQLACYLFYQNKQFVDRIVPYQNLMPQNLCKWRRAEEVFPREKYRNPDWSFQFQSQIQNRYSNDQIKEAFNWLQGQGRYLLQNICLDKQQEIFKPGLYRFMFCLNGKENTEVVIDSFIPIDNFGRYLFDQPKKGGGIWMILMVKALAKIVGSYQNLRSLSKKQILSQMTGYPNCENFEQLGQKSTYPLMIRGREQKYFKIGKNQSIKFNLYFWFNLKTEQSSKYIDRDNANDSLIVEIFEHREQLLRSLGLSCHKIPTVKFKESAHSNLLKIKAEKRQTIETEDKEAFIYLFNLSHNDISCHLVTQSDKKLPLKQSRTDVDVRECRLTKIQSLKFYYRQIHNDLENFQFSQYKLRCYWDKNRGIFCLKNTKQWKKTFRFIIKQQYRDSIFFEEKKNEHFLEEDVQPGMHSIFIVTRVKIQSYGPFYSIQCIQK